VGQVKTGPEKNHNLDQQEAAEKALPGDLPKHGFFPEFPLFHFLKNII